MFRKVYYRTIPIRNVTVKPLFLYSFYSFIIRFIYYIFDEAVWNIKNCDFIEKFIEKAKKTLKPISNNA